MISKKKSKHVVHSELTLLRQGRTSYPDSPDKAKLETFKNTYASREYWVHFDCPEFTSLCPVTHQPDFGSITIDYSPDKRCIESKSLKIYLFAFRTNMTFHEEVVNRILEDIVRVCKPRQARVTGKFNPRGGISITVTVEYP